MQNLKIKFCDFWQHFHEKSNYFYNLLAEYYNVEISENPEIVIYSCYGTEYLKYKCVRIFYSAENTRPDYSGCDFAISFDYSVDNRHFRLPLYALYLDQYPGSLEKLKLKKTHNEALEIWRKKTKFCCMVVSNASQKKRINFFKKLSKYKDVDSGGLILNNIGGPVKSKMDFIKDYRFVIAFENSVFPGYTTEKILEPLIADCIPLYWGNPLIEKDFNPNSFLNLNCFENEEMFIQEILKIEEDEEKASKLIMESKFNYSPSPDIDKQRVVEFFSQIVKSKDTLIPVAKRSIKYMHAFRCKKHYYKKRVEGKLRSILRQLYSK